ncbi:hypothetical protein VNO80_27799 [Phaseolus coccineus]|uniref:Uncharacterized protein n=1 Tax=Phaseolus coccineus TaxID=3886 RepID=A0AAN9LKC5_PHACN
MGVSSNPKVFLSDKDIKGPNILDPELGLLLHNQGCQAFIQEDHHLIRLKQLSVQERDQREEDNKDHHQEEQRQQQRNNIVVTTLKLEIPSSYVGSENEDDGYSTPTSSDNKIPAILECPGAPEKSKPKAATKRKACGRRIVLDLPQDLESLFPAPYVVDLGGGGVNKRVKHC